MTEKLCNRDNAAKAANLPTLNVSLTAYSTRLNAVVPTGIAFPVPVISPFCKRSMISSSTALERIVSIASRNVFQEAHIAELFVQAVLVLIAVLA